MSIKILIAEDNAFWGDAIRHTLSRQSSTYSVIGVALNGRLSLEMAIKHRPDIIFMNMEMSDMNGLEASEKIFQALPDTIIVSMFLWASEMRKTDFQKAGCFAHVQKNADANDFLKHITIASASLHFSSETKTQVTI